ncbi:MAG: recombinase family protein [Lachnospiraceae bacterium]|nr:recombinase family protein [Lachnospiraceae bacterium]
MEQEELHEELSADEENNRSGDTEVENEQSDSTKSAHLSDWQRRHEELAANKEEIRNRIRNTQTGNVTLHPAKPQPSITDGDMSVAVYARVSTKSEEQVSSIENQTLYYSKKIEDTPNWTMQKIYSDEGKSGTSMKHRTAFNQMIEDAGKKDFDLIICASVSRFARNMSDCMNVIRQLKTKNPSHPVGVYFETENIYTLKEDSMQSLSIHAMLADWESATKSSRMFLSYDQRIIMGQYPVSDLLGYRHTKDGRLIIQEDEAVTVRFIYMAALAGYGLTRIAEILTEKKRPTLKGRTEWNAGMVSSILTNERRWGDLEARKTVVVDYVDHKSKKNEGERVSAYVEGHHEGIVTPEIAKAAKLAVTSRATGYSIPDVRVICSGGLQGFVSVNPCFSGVNRDMMKNLSRIAYSDEEYAVIEQEARIISGDEHCKVMSMDFSGYYVPYSAYFIGRDTPTLTISQSRIKFNSKCLERFAGVQFVELLYHPLLQMIIIRDSDETCGLNIFTDDGSSISSFSTKAFCQAVYEEMDWIQDYSFRFRGIMRERGSHKAMAFYLDEPQVVKNKASRQAAEIVNEEQAKLSSRYIPITNSELKNPSETKRRKGSLYPIRKRRDSILDSLTYEDISGCGMLVDNPVIGTIPTRQDILDEIDDLLMSM